MALRLTELLEAELDDEGSIIRVREEGFTKIADFQPQQEIILPSGETVTAKATIYEGAEGTAAVIQEGDTYSIYRCDF